MLVRNDLGCTDMAYALCRSVSFIWSRFKIKGEDFKSIQNQKKNAQGFCDQIKDVEYDAQVYI